MAKLPINIKYRKKIHVIATVLFLFSLISANIGLFLFQNQHPSEFLIFINDVDRLPNGNTAIRLGQIQTTLKIAFGQERENCFSAIVEVDSNGKIVWEYRPGDPAKSHIDHEIKKKVFKGRTGYFYTDCLEDKIVFVDMETKEVTWEYWLGDINWQELNQSWDEDHYYNHPEISDWSHLNDIDFYDYGNWESMLLSIRDFNLITEVNLTSAQNKEKAEAADVVWWYGGDHILGCPHNPEYLPNGNILIVDSDHLRFIEVDKNTNEIVWEWRNSEIVTWPRDCDLMLDGERYLITDIDETFILNRNTGEVGLRIGFGGYEADYIEETNTIIVGGDTAGKAREFDADTGIEVWQWGGGGMEWLSFTNIIILIIFELYWIVMLYLTLENRKWLKLMPIFVLIGIELFLIIGYKLLNVYFFVQTIC